MKRVLLALPLLFLLCTRASAQAPVLFFTDLNSGPATGNSDTTFGAGGAYVTLYGNFLSGGTVTLNGASCLRSVSGPSTYLWYQKWLVQLTSTCATGNFVVTTPAGTSNGLAFTVRSGNIYYVSTTGNDGNSGTFQSPWATMAHCVQTMVAEGICYVENGVATGGSLDSGGWGALSLRQTWCGAGPNGFPRAIITYPGATATIGTTSGFGLVSTDTTAGDGACVGFWTVAGFTIRAGAPNSSVAVSLNGPSFPSGSSNWRIIGTDESCPNCNGSSSVLHTLQLGGTTNTNKFLGNNVHDSGVCFGSPCYPDDQYHGIYISDNSRHFELGWNSVSNIVACRGIQIYSNFNDEYDVSIHDNTIHDTTCDAIVLATLDPSLGPVSVFNNVMYHVGIGPQNLTEGGGSFDCIYHDRHLQSGTAGSGQIKVYNNSCYDSGSVTNSSYQSCNSMAAYNISNNDDTTTMLIQNNIGYQTYTGNSFCTTGVPYFFNGTSSSTALLGSNNLFFGVTAPTSNSVITGSITSNPLFVNTNDTSCPATCPVDLHLSTSSSPAIAAGSTSIVPVYDHDGRLRPSPPSIGAYEFAAVASGTFYAQTAVGSGTGVDCADAKALPIVAGDWVAGNTIHLCGTITFPVGTTGIPIVGRNGTSGSPITLLGEPGVILQSPRFNGALDGPALGTGPAAEGGAIDISATSSFIIVDGGTNGIIQNTANCTGCANSADSLGIWAGGDNIIVRNWTVKNIYNRTRGTTTGAGGSSGDIMVTGGATSIKVCNNTFNNASIGAELNFHTTPMTPGITSWANPASCQSNTFTPGAVFGNNTMDDHNWMSHVNGSGAPVIINNQFGPVGWSNWNGDTADFHQDGFFTVGNSAATFKPYFINNYMPGDQNQGSPSGMILYTDDGHASSGQGQSSVMVGNILYGTGGGISCCMGVGIQAVVTGNPKGPYQWYNNTYINFGNSIEDFAWQVASPTVDMRNNLFDIPVVTLSGWFFNNQNTGWSFSTLTVNGNSYFGGRAPGSPSGPFGIWTSNVDYPHWLTNCVAGSSVGALCDTNSANTDPLLAGESSFPSGGALTPSGFIPAANSPAANLGDNLASQCASIPNQCASMPQTVGAGGSCGTGCIARPAAGRWTAGAFQISGGAVSPNAPTGLTGTVTGSTVNLSWTAPTGTPAPTAYTEYRGTVHGGPYTAVQSGITSTSTTDTPASGTYFYTVTAFVGGVVSSIAGNGTTATVTCTAACAFPTGAVFTIAGNTQVSFNGTFTSTGQPTGSTFTFSSATNSSGTGGGVWQSGAESAKSNEVTVTTPATLTVSLLPASLAFGSFTVGTPSGTKQVTLTNTSAAGNTVTITSKTFSGANPGDYSETDNCPSLLLSGTSCTFNITFTPTAVGTRNATLSILDNASGSPQTTTVSGTGVAATPAVLLSPTSLNFGDQTVGVTSVSRGITLTNTGTGTLSISSIVASGDFAQGNTCGASVAPLASCAINVTFTPSVSGIRNGTITITDNAAGSPQVANLTGNGTTTKCQISANATLSGQAVVCGP